MTSAPTSSSSSSSSSTSTLNATTLSKFALAKVFKDNTARINSLSFSSSGDLLVTASDDESIHVYNCDTATLKRKVMAKRYGCDLVRFTHHNNAILVASQNHEWDESLRYLSLHDYSYLRYFKGHRDKVVSLQMSPIDDTFMSGSLDQSIRLWDLRTNVCQGLIRVTGRPAVAYDPQGLIFGAAASPNVVKLYDSRSYEKGPFATFRVPGPTLDWHGIRFSPDGKYFLLSTATNQLFLLDAFDGRQIQTYTSYSNKQGLSLEGSFSPDGSAVLCGSDDGSIHVWDTLSGAELGVWKGHSVPCTQVQFNPTRMMVASACSKLAWWIPNPATT